MCSSAWRKSALNKINFQKINLTKLYLNNDRNIEYFNIYRDGELIDDFVNDFYYIDETIDVDGEYCYEIVLTDQFGDEFDLYDLANQGKPILLEIGSASPKACNDFSSWRSHISDEATKQKWWKNKFSKVRDLIDNQDLYWVHIIHLDVNKNPATAETVRSWYENYPHDNIIVLADPESKMKTWIRPEGMPCMILVDEKMVIKARDIRGIEYSIDGLYRMLH